MQTPAEPRGVGVRTSPLFENMGLVIRPNLHGVRGIENVIEDRLKETEEEECK